MHTYVNMKYDLKFLERFYLSVVNDKNLLKACLNDKEFSPLHLENQCRILDVTVNNELCREYSPRLSYQKFFLRSMLDKVESDGCEVSDELIEAYAKSLSTFSNEEFFYRIYLINDDYSVTLKENSCFVINSTTGLQTWEASKYLLEWCLENNHLFKNRKVLELGSGIGLLGITVVKACNPLTYIFTDKSLDVLNILSENIAINLPCDTANQVVCKRQLFWETVHPEIALQLRADFLLGADIVFDPSVLPHLVKTLKIFFTHCGTNCAYIANAIRCVTNEYFLAVLSGAGLKYEILEFKTKNIFIYSKSPKLVLYRIFLSE